MFGVVRRKVRSAVAGPGGRSTGMAPVSLLASIGGPSGRNGGMGLELAGVELGAAIESVSLNATTPRLAPMGVAR